MLEELSLPQLLDMLRHEDWTLRQEATKLLQQIQNPNAWPTLLETWQDDDLSVRIGVVGALGNFEQPEVIAVLEQALFDEEWEVQWAAMRSLGQIYKEPLLRQMGDRLPEKRITGIQGLLKKPTPWLEKALCAALDDESDAVCKASIQALIKLNTTTAVPHLERHLLRATREQQAWLAEALFHLGSPTSLRDNLLQPLHFLPCKICQHQLLPSQLYRTQVWNEDPQYLCQFHFEEYNEKMEPFEGKLKSCKLCQTYWPKYEYVETYCPDCREQRYQAMPPVEEVDHFRCHRCHKLYAQRSRSPASTPHEPTCTRCAYLVATLTPKPPFFSDHAIHFLSEAFENGYFLCEQSRLFHPLDALVQGEDFRDHCLSKEPSKL